MILLAYPLLVLIVGQDAAPVVPAYPPAAEVKAAFLKLLDRPRVPLDVKKESYSPDNLPKGITEERWSIAVENHADGTPERVPIHLFKPTAADRKSPVVIVLHGTGGRASAEKNWCVDLAKQGIIGVSIDARHHGTRATTKGNAYNEAIISAWRAKPDDTRTYPFYFDTCWDVWRTIDYLQTRDDVDSNRIGLMGISKGGIETWLAGAVDDRVKVAVPCISVQSFRWSLDNDKWQGRANTIAIASKAAAKDRGESEVTKETCRALWNKVLPGILDQFDCPSMLRFFAGRPLLIIGGDEDPNCPLPGAKIAIASAEAAFRQANAADKLKVDIARKTGHTITKAQHQEILDWFAKWL